MSSIETQFPNLKTHHSQYPGIAPGAALKGSASGKTVFLSGASRGIGQATAVAFAEAGAAAVYITARSEKALLETGARIAEANPKTRCAYMVCDVTDAGRVEAAIDDCVTTFGGMSRTPMLVISTNGARSANRTSPVGGGHGRSI